MRLLYIAARRLALLCVILIIVAGLPLARLTAVKACPPPPPQPLRQLFTEADLVIVARIGQTNIVGEQQDEWQNETTLALTQLHVKRVIKGAPESDVINISRRIWSKQLAAEINTESDAYPPDKIVLAFLQAGSDVSDDASGVTNVFHINMENYGLKILDDKALTIYLQRLDELAQMYATGEPDTTQLQAWIVRCIEQSATRWEGAIELLPDYGFYDISYIIANDANPETTGNDVRAQVAVSDDVKPVNEADADAVDNEYAKEYAKKEAARELLVSSLTDEQKARITDALFSARDIGEGELLLMPFAHRWRDSRLTRFIIERLRENENPAEETRYIVTSLMTVLARTLGNQAAFNAAEKYQEAIYDDARNAQCPAMHREFLTLVENSALNLGANSKLISIHDSAAEEN